MKRLFTLFFVSCAVFALNAQTAQVYLTFEDGNIIPDGITGVTSVDGIGDVNVKNDATYSQSANAIITDGGENVLFTDYNGYIKFDHTLLNKNAFTIMSDYKWYGNNVWWLGLASIVGYDPVGDPDNFIDPGYISKQLQIKQPTGILDGFGLSTTEAVLTSDNYYHVALSYSAGDFNLYIDGALVASSTGQLIHSLDNPELYWGIKINTDAVTGDVSPAVDGGGFCKNTRVNMDNVALFNTALSAQEIANIASGTSIPTKMEGLSANVSIYPNPVVDILTINGDVARFEVYDLSGTMVFQSNTISSNTVDLSTLSKGMYLARILATDGSTMQSVKLIKK